MASVHVGCSITNSQELWEPWLGGPQRWLIAFPVAPSLLDFDQHLSQDAKWRESIKT